MAGKSSATLVAFLSIKIEDGLSQGFRFPLLNLYVIFKKIFLSKVGQSELSNEDNPGKKGSKPLNNMLSDTLARIQKRGCLPPSRRDVAKNASLDEAP